MEQGLSPSASTHPPSHFLSLRAGTTPGTTQRWTHNSSCPFVTGILRCIRAVAGAKRFPFMAKPYSAVCAHALLIHSSADGHGGPPHPGCCERSHPTVHLGCCPQVRPQGQVAILTLKAVTRFSTAAARSSAPRLAVPSVTATLLGGKPTASGFAFP